MGDTKKALKLLKKVDHNNPNFVEAKTRMADIYLKELMDRKSYTRCYMEILDADSSIANFKMVGNALMNIQEPEEAIKFYEQALMKDTEDISMIREVGKALVMTHDYNKAIRYYENALREDPNLLDLRTDLAEFYIKLKDFDKAKEILINAMKFLKEAEESDTNSMLKNNQMKVHYLLLMSKIFLEEDVAKGESKFKKNLDALGALKEARNTQAEVIEKCREMNSDSLDAERKIISEINYRLAKYLEEREANHEGAIQIYNDCLSKDEDHKEALISLAKLHQVSNDTKKCI